MTKYEKIAIFISITAFLAAAFSACFSCQANRLSREANNLSKQDDLRARAIAAIDDLQTATETLKGYERDGATFSDTQRGALASAGKKKQEARDLRNGGEYRPSIEAAAQGLHILEVNFPVSQYPELYYPRAEEWWRRGTW